MSRARITALAAVATAVLMLLALPAGRAGAHGPTGTLGIEATAGPNPLTLRVRALLEYSNDREVAPGATVSVDARVATTGQTVGPQPMTDQGRGLYETMLTLPAAGEWTMTVTAANPTATATAVVTTGTITGSLGTSSTSTTEARTPSDDGGSPGDTENADDGVSVVVIVGIMLVVGIAIGTAAAFARRRTPR